MARAERDLADETEADQQPQERPEPQQARQTGTAAQREAQRREQQATGLTPDVRRAGQARREADVRRAEDAAVANEDAKQETPSDDPEKWRIKTRLHAERGEPAETWQADGYRLEFFASPDKDMVGSLIAVNPDGEVIGDLTFGHMDGRLQGSVEVRPDMRRKGIATALYNRGEQVAGAEFTPSLPHSDDAAAFWRAREQRKQEKTGRAEIEAAGRETDTEPTEAQKQAGNYRKGRVRLYGHEIAIENPRGSKRSGTAPDGTRWETELAHDYGDIKGTTAADGDNLDVFLGPKAGDETLPVYVVDQRDPRTGEFDEHKVMVGFSSKANARRGYMANYEKGWRGLGAITRMSPEEFRAWLEEGDHRKAVGGVSMPPAERAKDPQLPRGTIQGGSKEIGELYDYAVSDQGARAKRAVSYDRVDDSQARQLKNDTGLDLEGYRHVIDSSGIRHSIKRHGDEGREPGRGQVAVTRADFEKIPEIVRNYDAVELIGQDRQGNDLIRYRKRFNGTTYYVEEERTGRRELVGKTLWKTRAAPSATPKGGVPHTSTTFDRNPPQRGSDDSTSEAIEENKQARRREQQANKQRTDLRRVDPETDTLVTAIQKLGGIDTELESDWRERIRHLRNRRPGLPGLERPGKGRSLDDLAESLQELGYIESRDASELAEKLSRVEMGEVVHSIARDTEDMERAAREAADQRPVDVPERERQRAEDAEEERADFEEAVREFLGEGDQLGSVFAEQAYDEGDSEADRWLQDIAEFASAIDADATQQIIERGAIRGDDSRDIGLRLIQEVIYGRRQADQPAGAETGAPAARADADRQAAEAAQPEELSFEQQTEEELREQERAQDGRFFYDHEVLKRPEPDGVPGEDAGGRLFTGRDSHQDRSGSESNIDRLGGAGNTESGSRESLSQPPQDRPGLSVSAVRKAADALRSGWRAAPDINVVPSESDLPQAVQAKIAADEAEGEVAGVFHSGSIYLVAENLRSEREVAETVLHEVVGHYGLRRLLGREFVGLLDEVARSYGKRGLREIAERYGLDLSRHSDRRIAAEEMLAHMAQTGERAALWQRFVALMREWLRRRGFDLRLTDAELVSLIERSREGLAHGEPVVRTPGTRFARNAPLPAPNGQPSNLNARQWREVRTEAFKRWFGDWETAALPVVMRDTTGSDLARRAAANFLGKPMTNGDITATVSRSSLNKMLSASAVKNSVSPQSHATAVGNLDKLFPLAVKRQSRTPVREGDQGRISAIHHFDAPMPFNGKVLRVKMLVKETTAEGQNNPLYTVAAVEIAKPVSARGESTSGEGRGPTPPTGFEKRFAQLVAAVKGKGVSKVVDDNGEPMVVYHGTPDARRLRDTGVFQTQDEKFAGALVPEAQKEVKAKRAYFFTDSRRTASSYARAERALDYQDAEPEVFSVYLSLQNPKVVDWGGRRWEGTEEEIQQAKEAGHDGIIIRNVVDDYQGAGSPSVVYVAFAPEQIKSATDNRGTFDPDNPDIRFHRAFHGSPHVFERFEMQRIGSGEGAQAFGWGLYFTDSRGIAEAYRNKLLGGASTFHTVRYGQADAIVDTMTPGSWHGITSLAEAADMPFNAVNLAIQALVRNNFDKATAKADIAIGGDLRRQAERFIDGATIEEPNRGGLYEVDLAPDPSGYLLWDEPIESHSDAVRENLDPVREWLAGQDLGGETALERWEDILNADFAEWDGRNLYRVLVREASEQPLPGQQDTLGSPQRDASTYLSSIGVPGIKYLDGASRRRGEGSFNYVVFDESLITVANRYRLGGNAPAPIPVEHARAHVHQIARGWANRPPIEVVQSESDLPDPMQRDIRAAGAEGQIRGVFHAGRAYIVADNNADLQQIEETLLHEVLGHAGLKGIFGDKLDGVMRDIYRAHQGDPRAIEIIERYGLDVTTAHGQAIAGEEMLAHMAQTGEIRVGLIKRVIARIRAFLREHFPRLALDWSDADILALLHRSRSFIQDGGRVQGAPVSQPRLHLGPDTIVGRAPNGEMAAVAQRYRGKWRVVIYKTGSGELFEQGKRKFTLDSASQVMAKLESFALIGDYNSPRVTTMKAQPLFQGGFTVPKDTLLDRMFVIPLIDRFKDLRTVQETIAASGGKMDEASDTYMREALYYGRAEKRIEDFRKHYVEPLLKKMSDLGVSLTEVNEYLYARHAKERNREMSKINPDLAPGEGSGMTDDEADAVMAAAQGKVEALERIASDVDRIVEKSRRLLVASGLEKEETVKSWESTYEHYVPLRGFEDMETEAEVSSSFLRYRGFDARGRERMAFGRRSKADNILVNALAQYESTAVRAEKNRVGQSMLRMVQANPNPDLWEINPVEYRPTRDPDTGLVVQKRDMNYRTADNVLVVKVRGRDQHIRFHGTRGTRMARALKNLDMGGQVAVIEALGRLNRLLAALNTSWNPEFVLTNFTRDLQTAALNLSDTQIRNAVGRVWRDVPKALGGIAAAKAGKDTEWARYFEEFERVGGKTGWIDAHQQLTDIQRKIAGYAKQAERGTADPRELAKNIARGLGGGIVAANEIAENATRLSVFVNARRAGLSADRAAMMAKEITVNFNRRGSLGRTVNALYLFFNAAMQGSARIVRALGSKRGRRVALGLVLASVAQDMLNRLLGGEDDDDIPRYDKIPDWVKERNWIVMTSDGDYFSVPLPYGWNVFKVIGDQIGHSASDLLGMNTRFDASDALARVANAAMGAFNPLGADVSLPAQLVSPTFSDPLLQIATNRDWIGRQIAPKPSPFAMAPDPDSQLYYDSTNPLAIAMADAMNKLSGGSEVRPGHIDMSPATIEHLAEFLGGGASRFVMDGTTSIWDGLVKGEKVEPYKIPFAGRFWGKVGDRADRNLFYDNLREIAYAVKEIEHARANRDFRAAQDVRREYGPELRMSGLSQSAEKQVRGLREKIDSIEASGLPREAKRRQVDRLRDQMATVMQQFNARYQKALEE